MSQISGMEHEYLPNKGRKSMRTISASVVALAIALFVTPSRADETSTACTANQNTLGVSRVVEIDTAGGPGFGSEQFKTYDFLRPGEIVLTFDDGPWPSNTPAVLKALRDQCTKAIFFPIGEHALWHPALLRDVAAAGHTVGSHTWSHANLAKLDSAQAKDEIEKGFSAVRAALQEAPSPFFRFPGLRYKPEDMTYLAGRDIATFSADLDSNDFKTHDPAKVISSVLQKLQKSGKGIILMHDFQHSTSVALPDLLAQLKAGGYKVVQVKSKLPAATLAEYDTEAQKQFGGSSADQASLSSVVRTIDETSFEQRFSLTR
jgi:peptidoglycan/xylan/chitin deacetylase (PgdA/CDA1 family)